MRFITFEEKGEERAGVLSSDGAIHPLARNTSLIDLLGDDGTRLQEHGEQALTDRAHLVEPQQIRLLAPIPNPPSVRDFMTFESHFAGCRGPANPIPDEWYQAPAFYFTNPYAIIGPDESVRMAPGTVLFDLELEVAAVIGKEGHDLNPAEGEDHIVGYSILVDWSARDLQFAEMQVGLGPAKGKDTATTLGPALVTSDELMSFRSGTSFALDMEVLINGQSIGHDRLDHMAFSFGDMVAYASRGTVVRPGDIIGSGTCGNGCIAEIWGRNGLTSHPSLQLGDLVTVSVQAIGTMTLEITSPSELIPIPPARRHPSASS